MDSVKYTDQELYTLDTFLTKEVGKMESVQAANMYERTDKMKKSANEPASKDATSQKDKVSLADRLSMLIEDGIVKEDELFDSGISRERLVADFDWKDKIEEVPVEASFLGKKYKPVDKKVKPVLGTLSEEFRIVRKRHSDLLVDMSKVSIHSKPFKPIERLMQQRLNALKLEENKFL